MQRILDFPLNEVMNFGNFVECDGNAASLRFARRIADPDDSEHLLYIHGPSGSGKTHLLRSVEHEISVGSPSIYLSCREMPTTDILMRHFGNAEALILDDIHLLPDDRGVKSALWQLFNDFSGKGMRVVMAGTFPPRELSSLDDHLVSRLLWGLVSRVDVTDDNSRRMILQKAAYDRQVRVPDDVLDYLLKTGSREAGYLVRCIELLYRLSLETKRKITLSLLKEALELKLTGAD